MLTQKENQYLTAVAAMSHYNGSYGYLIMGQDGWPYLAHGTSGHVPLYAFGTSP